MGVLPKESSVDEDEQRYYVEVVRTHRRQRKFSGEGDKSVANTKENWIASDTRFTRDFLLLQRSDS